MITSTCGVAPVSTDPYCIGVSGGRGSEATFGGVVGRNMKRAHRLHLDPDPDLVLETLVTGGVILDQAAYPNRWLRPSLNTRRMHSMRSQVLACLGRGGVEGGGQGVGDCRGAGDEGCE